MAYYHFMIIILHCLGKSKDALVGICLRIDDYIATSSDKT